METYKIYCNLKSELKKKKQLLSDLQQKAANKADITSLEIDIEEDMNALNIIFNHLVLHHHTLNSIDTE